MDIRDPVGYTIGFPIRASWQMDWKRLIGDLVQSGMTQVEIARECGVAQSTVSDLHRGSTESPSYDFGDRLLSLHRERVLSRSAPPQQAA